jgi:hypothetical protein
MRLKRKNAAQSKQFKKCSRCKLKKERDQFYRWTRSADGLHNQCKACHNLSANGWKRKNPEKAKSYWREWTKRNAEKVKAAQKKYRAANLEKCRARSRKWHSTHTEQRAIRDKQRRFSPEKRYLEYRAAARQAGRSFALTYDQFYGFWQKPCFYCRQEIKFIGLDRINNALGYAIDNVVSCCTRCNMMKKNLGQSVFIQQCMLISKFHTTQRQADNNARA